MSIYGIGTDIVSIKRIKLSVKKKIFIKRIFNRQSNSFYADNISSNSINFHDFKIFLKVLIALEIPTNIDSPIKKCPILNSDIPLILDNILADIYVSP